MPKIEEGNAQATARQDGPARPPQQQQTPRQGITRAGCFKHSRVTSAAAQSSSTSNPEITPMPITAESSMLLDTSVS